MKTEKLLVIVAISCLLLGVSSGVAMAEGCGDGFLQGETFDGNLRITDDNCVIIGSTIEGNLRVINSDNVVLIDNKVGGRLRVDGNAGNGTAVILGNKVYGGSIVVRDLQRANIVENQTLAGDIRLLANTSVLLKLNISAGDIVCRNNTSVDDFANYAAGELRGDCF